METLYSPSGEKVWSSEGKGQLALPSDETDGLGRRRALAELLGGTEQPLCTTGDVLRQMAFLGFVDRAGSPPGFLTVLPRGVAFEQAVEAMNDVHVAELRAVQMQFPLVFDRTAPDMQALTESYVGQGRVFDLAAPDIGMSLAYASDPGIFSWLRGRAIVAERLPYAIYSPAPAFRRWQSGELGLRALRQYTLPDLHVICLPEQAREMLLTLIAISARIARVLFGSAFVQLIEVSEEFAGSQPDLVRDAARTAGQFTVQRVLPAQLKYFALKAGINVDIGAGSNMLFNFQWDNTNSERFSFRAGERAVVVLHATVSGALTKVLPAVIGRGLSGLGPRVLPVGLAPVQVLVLPLGREHVPAAESAVGALSAKGLRAAAGQHAGSLSARVRASRAAWNPLHSVVGDAEAAGCELRLHSPVARQSISVDELLAVDGVMLGSPGTRPCQPRLDTPFA